jgi:hypothetical protein
MIWPRCSEQDPKAAHRVRDAADLSRGQPLGSTTLAADEMLGSAGGRTGPAI